MPSKSKGAKAKRSKGKGDDPQSWLEVRIAQLTLDLEGRGAVVPPPEQQPQSSIVTHGKGATEKRRMRGNTKATQKAMRNMHLHVLEQRALQLERLVGGATGNPPPAHPSDGERRSGGGVIFGIEVPPGPWKGEGSDDGGVGVGVGGFGGVVGGGTAGGCHDVAESESESESEAAAQSESEAETAAGAGALARARANAEAE